MIKTKLRFKIIATLISLSLAGLMFSQGYWLKGLYDSTWKQVNDNIQEAMRMADYKEVFHRMEELTANNYHGEIKQEIAFSKDSTENTTKTGAMDSFAVDTDKNSLENEDITESLDDYLSLLDNLEGQMQLALHQKIDSLQPVNYILYDSLLTVELQQRNIFVPHKLEVVQLIDGEPKAYMNLCSSGTFQTVDPWKDATCFTYPIFTQPEQYYRLLLKTPAQLVLKQMTGILISSFLLILLILLAFFYLMQTILKQKTLDELKTDFTNNMTHELKTPISVAYAANDVLLNYENKTSEKQKKYLNIIQEQLTQLSGLVEQILTLSVENRNTLRLKLEPISVVTLLPPLIEQHKLKTDKPVRINTDIPETLTISADQTHFYNMLGNLIDNAIKYAGDKPCEITINAVESTNETCISVSDTGIGISETNLAHIFDKFYRGPNGNLHNVKGYGLGLYYVSDMMAKHKGYVTVKSQLGKGTTFTLHFKH